MPEISDISIPPVVAQNAQPVERAENAQAPAELAGARPSRAAVAGRVVLGIFTLGISEGIRAIVRACRSGQSAPARAPRQAVPEAAPTVDALNHAMAEQIRSPENNTAVRLAILEGLGVYAEAFGADFAQNGLDEVPFKNDLIRSLGQSVGESTEAVTPERLRSLAQETAGPMVGRMLLEKAVQDCCRAVGFHDAAVIRNLPNTLLWKFPDLRAEIEACRDLPSARAAVDAHLAEIRNYVDLRHELTCAEEEATQRVYQGVARNTGLDEGAVRDTLSVKKLLNRLTVLKQSISSGERPLRGEALKDAFRAAADRFIQEKTQLFRTAGELDLSAALKLSWQHRALSESTLSKGDIYEVCHRVAQTVPTDNLTAALRTPDEFSTQDLAGLVITLGARLQDQLIQALGIEAWDELGGDGQGDMRFYSAQAVIDANPELRELLTQHPDTANAINRILQERIASGMSIGRVDARHASEVLQSTTLTTSSMSGQMLLMAATTAASPNKDLLAGIESGNLPLMHADSLHRVVADLKARFAGALPEGGLDKLMKLRSPASDKTLAQVLKETIAASPDAVTPATVERLAQDHLHSVAAHAAFRGLLRSVAETAHLQHDDTQVSVVARQLRERHPELADGIRQAADTQALSALLRDLPEARELLRVRHDIMTAWDAGYRDVYARMAALTGTSVEAMHKQLNIRKIDQGGKFGILRKEITDVCSDRTAPIPSSEEIGRRFAAIVESFVSSKTGLWQSIDTLHLPPAVAEAWKSEIITNTSMSNPNFLVHCAAVGRQIQPGGLARDLSASTVKDENLLALFASVAKQQNEIPHTLFGEEVLSRLDSDELGTLGRLGRQLFVAEHPDLRAAVQAHSDKVERVRNLAERSAYQEQRTAAEIANDNSPEMAAHLRAYGDYIGVCKLIDELKVSLD